MKKCMLTLGAIALCATTFGAMKIATVETPLLVRNHKNYESNKNFLQNTEKDYQKEIDTLRGELDDLQEQGVKLAEELGNPMLSDAAKKASEEKLKDLQRRFAVKRQELNNVAMKNQQDLAKSEARLLKAQAEDIKAYISKYAEKEGYDLIIDATAALYVGKGVDVTDEILKQMGVDPKAARAKEKDESK